MVKHDINIFNIQRTEHIILLAMTVTKYHRITEYKVEEQGNIILIIHFDNISTLHFLKTSSMWLCDMYLYFYVITLNLHITQICK